METLNKSCLQVPRPQTIQKIQGKARPHVTVLSAPRQKDCYTQFGKELRVAKESGRKLKSWLLREEAKINKRFTTRL